MSSPVPKTSALRLQLPRLAAPRAVDSDHPSTSLRIPTPPPTATFPFPSFVCSECENDPPAYHRQNLLVEHRALKHFKQFVTCDTQGTPLVVRRSSVEQKFHCPLCGDYSTESALVCSLHIQHTCTYALGAGKFVLKGRVEGVRLTTDHGGLGSLSSSSSVQPNSSPRRRRANSVHADASCASPPLLLALSHPTSHRKTHSLIALPISSLLLSHPSPSTSVYTQLPPSQHAPAANPPPLRPQTNPITPSPLILENASLKLQNHHLKTQVSQAKDELQNAQLEIVRHASETIGVLFGVMKGEEGRLRGRLERMGLGVGDRVGAEVEVERESESEIKEAEEGEGRRVVVENKPPPPTPFLIIHEPKPTPLLQSYRSSGIKFMLNPSSAAARPSFPSSLSISGHGQPSLAHQTNRTPSFASSSAQFFPSQGGQRKKHPRSISTAEWGREEGGKRVR